MKDNPDISGQVVDISGISAHLCHSTHHATERSQGRFVWAIRITVSIR
jgi:hypothetical protein